MSFASTGKGGNTDPRSDRAHKEQGYGKELPNPKEVFTIQEADSRNSSKGSVQARETLSVRLMHSQPPKSRRRQ